MRLFSISPCGFQHGLARVHTRSSLHYLHDMCYIIYAQETRWAPPEGAVVVPAKAVMPPSGPPAVAPAASVPSPSPFDASAAGAAASSTRRPTDAGTLKEGWLDKSDPTGKRWKRRCVMRTVTFVIPWFEPDILLCESSRKLIAASARGWCVQVGGG